MMLVQHPRPGCLNGLTALLLNREFNHFANKPNYPILGLGYLHRIL